MKPSRDYYAYYYRELLKSKRERMEFIDYMRNWMPPSHTNSDSDTSIWVSALGMYKIQFHKEEATLFYNPGLFHYVITMTVFDNIGLVVFEIKFSENDAVALINNIVCKVYNITEFYGAGTDTHYMMKLNRNANLVANTVFMDIKANENFPDEVEYAESIYYNEAYSEPRDLEFVVSYYNKITETIMNSVVIPVSITEVYDILDALIVILADVELPTDQEDMLSDAIDWLRS